MEASAAARPEAIMSRPLALCSKTVVRPQYDLAGANSPGHGLGVPRTPYLFSNAGLSPDRSSGPFIACGYTRPNTRVMPGTSALGRGRGGLPCQSA
jgi:hypothetical protein